MFIIAKDWSLRAGVRAQLREEGVDALGMESTEDMAQSVAAGAVPSAIVWEATEDEVAPELDLLARRVPVIVVASRTRPVKLPANPAAVLYRPVGIGEVAARVHTLLRGQAV